MGKVRVKTFGDEEQEKVDAKKAKARAEAKRAQKEAASNASEKESEATPPIAETKPEEKQEEAVVAKPKEKKEKFKAERQAKHSKQYVAVSSHVEKDKKYTLKEAITLLPKLQRAKFDETVELHINTTDKGISGSVVLPHGTGKATRIEIADQTTNPEHVEELLKNIEAGKIDFDVLIATPDAMVKLARVARVLGPRGLMPNPKNGTVTPKPEEVAKKFQGGQMNFKTEAKFPLLHLAIGKISFGEEKLTDNAKAMIAAVSLKNIKTATLKSTMSPGVKLDTSSFTK